MARKTKESKSLNEIEIERKEIYKRKTTKKTDIPQTNNKIIYKAENKTARNSRGKSQNEQLNTSDKIQIQKEQEKIKARARVKEQNEQEKVKTQEKVRTQKAQEKVKTQEKVRARKAQEKIEIQEKVRTQKEQEKIKTRAQIKAQKEQEKIKTRAQIKAQKEQEKIKTKDKIKAQKEQEKIKTKDKIKAQKAQQKIEVKKSTKKVKTQKEPNLVEDTKKTRKTRAVDKQIQSDSKITAKSKAVQQQPVPVQIKSNYISVLKKISAFMYLAAILVIGIPICIVMYRELPLDEELSKNLINIGFILVIMGKFIVVIRKLMEKKTIYLDFGALIGFIMAFILYKIS